MIGALKKCMTYCSKCGNEETSDKSFCSKCGSVLSGSMPNMSKLVNNPRSRGWYLLPIFFSIIGGVIAYLVLKDDDKPLAKNCLIIGFVMLLFGLIIGAISSAFSSII